MMQNTLQHIPGASADLRTAVVECVGQSGDVSLELRFEQHVDGAGWVVQRRLSFGSDEVELLRNTLQLFTGNTRVQSSDGTLSIAAGRNRRRVVGA